MLTSLTRRLRDDSGNVLIIVILVSFLVGSLAALTLASGTRSDQSSSRDRNSDIALGVTEAGVHQAIATIEAKAKTGLFVNDFAIPDTTTPEGTYRATIDRTGQGYEIESWGRTGGTQLGRGRHLKVTLMPPPMFGDGKYALFSFTSIELKNKDKVYAGDVWANDSITADQGVEITGSVTSAQSWIDFKGNSVGKNIWAGGRHVDNGWAMRVDGTVGGWAKASMSSPACQGEVAGDYDMLLGTVTGDATVPPLGSFVGGTVTGARKKECTAAAPAKPLPAFTFSRANYDDPAIADDYREFIGANAVIDFQTFIASNGGVHEGTVYVEALNPSQTNRIVLSALKLSGNMTIVTNTPVFAHQGPTDSALAADEQALFQVISSYDPPPSTSCDINHDNSECAIHFKNKFDPSCKTAVLIYADKGPVAVKNDNAANDPNNTICGSIVSDAIAIKNNQSITYDPRVDNVLGFGSPTYIVERWEELAPS